MADFYQTRPTNDPNYLGLSKEPGRVKADTSLGELFEGIGNLGGMVIKGTDALIKDAAGKRVREEIEPIMDKYTGLLDQDSIKDIAGTGAKGKVRLEQMRAAGAAGQPTYEDGGVGVGVSGYAPEDAKRDLSQIESLFPIKKEDQQLPPMAQAQFDRLERLKQAYYSGNFSQTAYNGEVYAALKRVRTEFPGYENAVDAAQERLTGEKAANTLRRSLMSDIQANLSAQLAAGNDEKKFREKYRAEIAASGYDDTTPINTVKIAVNKLLAVQYKNNAANLQASVDSPEAEANLTNQINQVLTGSLVAAGNRARGGLSLQQYIEKAQSAAASGGLPPKEHAELVRNMEAAAQRVQLQATELANQPQDTLGGRSLINMVKDGGTRFPAILKAQMDMTWNHAISLVKSQSYSALAINVDALKYRDTEMMVAIRNKFPEADAMAGVAAAFPNNELIQRQFLTHSKLLPQLQQAAVTGLKNAILGGTDQKPAPTPSEVVTLAKPTDQKQTNAIYKQTADAYDLVISPENKRTDNATHVAKKFFTDLNYYEGLSAEGRMKLFLKMAAPSKTQYIKELAQKDPEVEASYSRWAQYVARDIWNRASSNLQAQLSDPRYDIRFSLDKMAFVDHTNYRTPDKWNISRTSGVEQRGVQSSINSINNAITYLRPIVGDKPADILPALGVNPQSLKEDLIGKKIFDAVAGAVLKGAANAKKVVEEGSRDAAQGVSDMQKWNEIFGDRIENPSVGGGRVNAPRYSRPYPGSRGLIPSTEQK